MKRYTKPNISTILVESNNILSSSTEPIKPDKKQCDCPQHTLWGGCNGCEGNCSCGGC